MCDLSFYFQGNSFDMAAVNKKNVETLRATSLQMFNRFRGFFAGQYRFQHKPYSGKESIPRILRRYAKVGILFAKRNGKAIETSVDMIHFCVQVLVYPLIESKTRCVGTG
jgi:hypothetical protein